jgi:hypothetical protein
MLPLHILASALWIVAVSHASSPVMKPQKEVTFILTAIQKELADTQVPALELLCTLLMNPSCTNFTIA